MKFYIAYAVMAILVITTFLIFGCSQVVQKYIEIFKDVKA